MISSYATRTFWDRDLSGKRGVPTVELIVLCDQRRSVSMFVPTAASSRREWTLAAINGHRLL
jgi:hypothetical protein